MRGFKNGCNLVRDLLNSNTIAALQEHWLRPDNMSILGLISDGVSYYGASVPVLATISITLTSLLLVLNSLINVFEI